MAGHFKQEDTKKRSRRPLVVGAVVGVLVVAAVGFIAWKVVFSPKELSVEVQEEPSSLVTDPPADVGAQEGASLPFSLSDVPTDAAVTEVSAQGDPAALSDEWTFGGDYVTIGSFPVDADTVFGSTTTTPRQLRLVCRLADSARRQRDAAGDARSARHACLGAAGWFRQCVARGLAFLLHELHAVQRRG